MEDLYGLFCTETISKFDDSYEPPNTSINNPDIDTAYCSAAHRSSNHQSFSAILQKLKSKQKVEKDPNFHNSEELINGYPSSSFTKSSSPHVLLTSVQAAYDEEELKELKESYARQKIWKSYEEL